MAIILRKEENQDLKAWFIKKKRISIPDIKIFVYVLHITNN